jgi:hypothetical protein
MYLYNWHSSRQLEQTQAGTAGERKNPPVLAVISGVSGAAVLVTESSCLLYPWRPRMSGKTGRGPSRLSGELLVLSSH